VDLLYFVALNALAHAALVGGRMTTSLFALELGASPFSVGLLMALFAALPMLLSISTGRLIDRVGPRRPLALAFFVLTGAALVPWLFPSLPALFVSSTLLGTSFMLVHIGMNTVIGAHGEASDRPMNFAWLALAFSISGSSGPLIAGFAIEGLGHARAFLVLAFFPALAFVLLMRRKAPLPRPAPHEHGRALGGVFELFRIRGLRQAFLVSGLLATGWDLYSFLLPLYGAEMGLTAGSIGVVMASFAVATFVVRIAMRIAIRRVRQWAIVITAMSVAGLAYLMFPLASTAPQLMALSFLLGLGLGCAQPVIMSLLYDAAPPGRQSEAVGVRTTMINASQTGIPLVSGALSVAFGMAPVFCLLAGCLLGGAVYVLRKVK
jgi:MFS family permease